MVPRYRARQPNLSRGLHWLGRELPRLVQPPPSAPWTFVSGAGLKLRELAATAGGIDYVSLGMALKRLEQRLPSDQPLAKTVQIAESKLVEM